MATRPVPTSASPPPVAGGSLVDAYAEKFGLLFGAAPFVLSNIGGTADAITADVDPELVSGVESGMAFWLTPTANNTGAVTLAIGGGSSIGVKDDAGNALVANTLKSGQVYLVLASGSELRALGTLGAQKINDYQEFTSSGTWYKPAGTPDEAIIFIEVIGGGGGGGNGGGSDATGGGGGGGCLKGEIKAGFVSSSISVTIGAGGTAGNAGGSSSFGSHGTAYGGGKGGRQPSGSTRNAGGGGGGGALSAGGDGGNGDGINVTGGAGGDPTAGAGGGVTGTIAAIGSNGYYGGGGGGGIYDNATGRAGGKSVFGGAGGASRTGGTGGTSIFAGDGGASGVDGQAPGGGGGAEASGARGVVRIHVIG